MADYKRLVSYMYNYENGAKGTNVGYARVESRNGQCRIYIRIRVPSLNNEELKVYFFKRDGYSIEGIPLGVLSVKNGIGQFRTITDSNNIMKTSYSLDDIGGMVLYYSDKRYLATEWDDKPVTKEMVNTSLLMTRQKEVKEDKEGAKLEQATSDIDHIVNEEVDSVVVNKETDKTAQNLIKDSLVENKEINKRVEDNEANETIEDKEIAEYIEEKEVVQIIEDKKASEHQEDIDSKLVKDTANEEDTDKHEVTKNDEDLKEPEAIKKAEKEEVLEKEKLSQVDSSSKKLSQEASYSRSKKKAWPAFEEHPDALRIYNGFPKMYPFEDNEIAWCVRFEPQDIGLLPMENWSLGNNSFLLHGFYCYSHLIFARINDKNGIKYILGVPGIYHNRERFMAKMFGFDFFKSIKRKELRIGEFGYWYAPIYFN